jgi:hypothetical protein
MCFESDVFLGFAYNVELFQPETIDGGSIFPNGFLPTQE